MNKVMAYLCMLLFMLSVACSSEDASVPVAQVAASTSTPQATDIPETTATEIPMPTATPSNSPTPGPTFTPLPIATHTATPGPTLVPADTSTAMPAATIALAGTAKEKLISIGSVSYTHLTLPTKA
mgnify:CR=1 FL=1